MVSNLIGGRKRDLQSAMLSTKDCAAPCIAGFARILKISDMIMITGRARAPGRRKVGPTRMLASH